MDTSDITNIIADSSWFQGVPREVLHQLALSAHLEHHKKKSYLYKVNDIVDQVYFIVSGNIRISLSSNIGNQLHLKNFGPGVWLGEFGLMSNDPQIMDLEFKEAGETLNLNCKQVNEIAQQYPIIYQNILKDHDSRTRGTYQILKSMLFNPLKSRLAGRILHIVKDLEINQDGSVYIDAKISQKELANQTHGSRQHVYKILKQWTEDGIILTKGSKFFIPNVSRLKQEAYLLDK